jgi:hypothetical protein
MLAATAAYGGHSYAPNVPVVNFFLIIRTVAVLVATLTVMSVPVSSQSAYLLCEQLCSIVPRKSDELPQAGRWARAEMFGTGRLARKAAFRAGAAWSPANIIPPGVSGHE